MRSVPKNFCSAALSTTTQPWWLAAPPIWHHNEWGSYGFMDPKRLIAPNIPIEVINRLEFIEPWNGEAPEYHLWLSLAKSASFTLALNSPHRKLQPQATDAKQVWWVAGADTHDEFLCLKWDIWPRNEWDIVVSKSASFGHGSLVWVVYLRMAGVWYVGTWYILHMVFMYQGY